MQKLNALDKTLVFLFALLIVVLLFFVEVPKNNIEVVRILSEALVSLVQARE